MDNTQEDFPREEDFQEDAPTEEEDACYQEASAEEEDRVEEDRQGWEDRGQGERPWQEDGNLQEFRGARCKSFQERPGEGSTCCQGASAQESEAGCFL